MKPYIKFENFAKSQKKYCKNLSDYSMLDTSRRCPKLDVPKLRRRQMEQGYAEAFRAHATTAPDRPTPFLASVSDKLSDALSTASIIGSRLAQAGFYGPPSASPLNKGPTSPEADTVRSTIMDALDELQTRLREVEAQIERLV
jgi:hypothetical protein